MNWKTLTTETQWNEILTASHQKPQLVYKHSTRCPTSSMVKSRLERSAEPTGIDFHYLDLIAYRAISNKIEADLNVRHESPQVLLIKEGKCIFDESHMAIMMDDIAAQAL